MRKADGILFAKRVNQVQAWILQDIPVDMMIRQIIQLDWCTTDRAAYNYISAAKERWIRNLDQDVNEMVKLKVIELQERKRTLKEEFKGTPAGIKALNEIDKLIIDLLGLNKPIQVHVRTKITRETIKEYTTDQLISMMEHQMN